MFDVSFTIPLRELAKGNFYVSLGIYQADEIGRMIPLAHITRAFQVELPGLPIWNTTAQGYVHLSEIKAEGVRNHDSV